LTVVAHEFGHALGLGESSVSTAVMYGTYNALKQALTSDDIAGVQSLYGQRQPDQFDSNGQNNNAYTTATNINAYLGGNAQIAIPNLDITTTSDTDWYAVTVPSSTTGTMTVTVQSSNLSSLSPKFLVYSASLGLVSQASAPNSFGATITTTATVTAGQSYYIKVMAAGGPGPIGAYGLLVNFGSQAQPPILPPNTVVAAQPDQGGGTSDLNAPLNLPGTLNIDSTPHGAHQVGIGFLNGWADGMTFRFMPAGQQPPTSSSSLGSVISATIQGVLFGVISNIDSSTPSILTSSSPNSSDNPGSPATFVLGALPSALQALDEVLSSWSSSS
jgi:hypothetical protein